MKKKEKPIVVLWHYFDKINRVFSICAIVFLVFITLSVTSEVLLRYFFRYSLIWVVEISQYMLLWIAFLSSAWVLKREGHVKMDLVLSRLSLKNQALLNSITSMMGASVCLIVCWFSGEVTWDHYLRGAAEHAMLEIPKAPIMAIIPIGSFLLFAQFIKRAQNYYNNWKALGAQ